MKSVQSRQIREVLRTIFHLRPASQGNGTGHELWVDDQGRRCRPVLRNKDIAWPLLYSLGLELEAKGITTRRTFLAALKAA